VNPPADRWNHPGAIGATPPDSGGEPFKNSPPQMRRGGAPSAGVVLSGVVLNREMVDQSPQQSCPRVNLLLRVVLLVFAGQLVVFSLANRLFGSGYSVLSVPLDGGWDFTLLQHGARDWLAGRDPYRLNGFVTPPLSLVIPLLLSHLSVDRATLLFVCANLVLVPLALWWYAAALRLERPERVFLLVVSALFISAQECTRGGNMDGVMFVLLVAAFSVRRRLGGALWLAASMATKLYSIILLPVALRRRQWRFAALTVGVTLALLLPFYRLWPSALHALVARNARGAHASIAPSTLIFALLGGPGKAAKILFLAFWTITFVVALYRDRGSEFTPRTLARYIPWMIALPALVFSYEGVLALAVLASLAATARERPLRRAEYCCFAGFLLLGIHVERVTDLMPLSYGTSQWFWVHQALVQSCGVVMIILGTCFAPGNETFPGAASRRAAGPQAKSVNWPLTRPEASGHPLPTGEGRGYLSFSPGEKVAEGRGRMRGLVRPPFSGSAALPMHKPQI